MIVSRLNRSRWKKWTLAAITTAIAAGCADSGPPVVGIAMGTMADIAVLPIRQKQFNDSVGERRQVVLKTTQTGAFTDDLSGLSWANQLVATSGIVGVVGHESSRAALQAAPLYAERNIVQIVPTGTSARLSDVSPWTFPLVASDSSQGHLLAKFLLSRNRLRITMFVQDDEYGRGVAAALRNGLKGSRAQVLEEVTHTMESDFRLLVRSVLKHEPAPDALVLITQGSFASTIAELSWQRDSTLLIVGSDATSTGAADLRRLAPSPAQLVLATYWLPDTTDSRTKNFLSEYREAKLGDSPQWYSAALYDAVGLLSAAASEVGRDPRAVREWMLSLGRTRPAYQGVLGTIDFTGEHPIAALLVRPAMNGWELAR